MSAQILFELDDDAGRTLQVAEEDNGTVTVSIFAPGMSETDAIMALDDTDVGDLQLTLAAYLHNKRE